MQGRVPLPGSGFEPATCSCRALRHSQVRHDAPIRIRDSDTAKHCNTRVAGMHPADIRVAAMHPPLRCPSQWGIRVTFGAPVAVCPGPGRRMERRSGSCLGGGGDGGRSLRAPISPSRGPWPGPSVPGPVSCEYIGPGRQLGRVRPRRSRPTRLGYYAIIRRLGYTTRIYAETALEDAQGAAVELSRRRPVRYIRVI